MGLKDKASKIDFSSLGAPAGDRADRPGGSERPDRPVPKTAPGALMDFAFEKRAGLEREVDDLRQQVAKGEDVQKRLDEALAELSAWSGAEPARPLDPRKVRPSRWANRDDINFHGPEFEAFCDELSSAGGNVQAIMVRPLPDGEEHEFEIAFGHRRHAACLARGLPLLAVVSSISDRDLFAFMDRENRSRKDLSPLEQGRMYRQALEQGLYPSNRKLADAVGADLGLVGKALDLADLPAAVVEAFESPLDLQYRWAKPLKDALAADPDGVQRRAAEIKQLDQRPKAAEILERLVRENGPRVSARDVETIISARGKPAAKLRQTARGGLVVEFVPGAVGSEQVSALAATIKAFIERA